MIASLNLCLNSNCLKTQLLDHTPGNFSELASFIGNCIFFPEGAVIPDKNFEEGITETFDINFG